MVVLSFPVSVAGFSTRVGIRAKIGFEYLLSKIFEYSNIYVYYSTPGFVKQCLVLGLLTINNENLWSDLGDLRRHYSVVST